MIKTYRKISGTARAYRPEVPRGYLPLDKISATLSEKYGLHWSTSTIKWYITEGKFGRCKKIPYGLQMKKTIWLVPIVAIERFAHKTGYSTEIAALKKELRVANEQLIKIDESKDPEAWNAAQRRGANLGLKINEMEKKRKEILALHKLKK